MWAIRLVLGHPAIHKFNQTLTWPLTRNSVVQAAARLHFQDNNFTEASFTPIHPPFTPYRLSQSDSGKGKECVKGTPEFLYSKEFLRAEAIDDCFVCLKSVLTLIACNIQRSKEAYNS
jgi:hypothetical protein